MKIGKRQQFVGIALILSLGLFLAEHLTPSLRIVLLSLFAFCSSLLLFLILLRDLKGASYAFFLGLFILPMLYTLAFGFFYFLLPARFLTRILTATFYGVGLYALFLSHNIYAVAGIRTIQLLKAAHSVGFLLTLVTFFFLTNFMLSLHLHPMLTALFVLLLSVLLIFPLIWSIKLENHVSKQVLCFSFFLSLSLGELALMLNFWPASPTVGALFLSGNFYTFVGLSQAWLEQRLFKNTLWEYIGVAIIVFLVLITRTKWGG